MTKFTKNFAVCVLVCGMISLTLVIYVAYWGASETLSAKVLRSSHLPLGISSGRLITASDVEKEKEMWKLIETRRGLREALDRIHDKRTLAILIDRLGSNQDQCIKWKISVDNCLPVAWAASRTHNAEVWQMAEGIERQIWEGVSFEELAKKYSQDEATRVFAGDAGYVDPGEVLPEFASELLKMPSGEVKIIPSRHGLHVVKADEVITDAATKKNLYRVFEIFLSAAPGLNEWKMAALSKYQLQAFVR